MKSRSENGEEFSVYFEMFVHFVGLNYYLMFFIVCMNYRN